MVGGLLEIAVPAVQVTAKVFVATDFVGGTALRASTNDVADGFGFFLFLICRLDGDGTAFWRLLVVLEIRRIVKVTTTRGTVNPLHQFALVFAGIEAAFANVLASMTAVVVITFLTSVAKVE